MEKMRNRNTETIIYAVLWLIAIALYLLDVMRNRALMSQPLMEPGIAIHMIKAICPFVFLFIINNYILIPRLLLCNKLRQYFLCTTVMVILLWTYQYFEFMRMIEMLPEGERPLPHPRMQPLIPLPLFLDFIYALLVVGSNLAIALMFQRFDDKFEKESLMKANAENQLAYLKAQINPHFYMNMLNNIHGMIELDPEKAQSMVINLSQLMRYMLYESSKPLITLSDEVAFISNYMNIMRQRYPEEHVDIISAFPSDDAMTGKYIPPLLTLVLIENAFKHGISYREKSYVRIRIDLSKENMVFECVNSNHIQDDDKKEHSGIGLRNIRQRLFLIYGERAQLKFEKNSSSYMVKLIIPAHTNESNSYR